MQVVSEKDGWINQSGEVFIFSVQEMNYPRLIVYVCVQLREW